MYGHKVGYWTHGKFVRAAGQAPKWQETGNKQLDMAEQTWRKLKLASRKGYKHQKAVGNLHPHAHRTGGFDLQAGINIPECATRRPIPVEDAQY